ncbi:MAG: hypothetical protein INR73_06585 [Williamsia sp.]|nr:hypothetical protein [Williamsia sp.]
MSWQKHIIRKQVIELQIPGSVNSREIHERTSQVVREQLLPLMDQVLCKHSAAGTVEKIDRLELDLGIIPVSRLEELLVQHATAELENKLQLTNQKNAAAAPEKQKEKKGEQGSALDMIAYFLHTGLFPWWATEIASGAFGQALEEALLHQPVRLKDLLHTLLRQEAVLKRLIYSCEDALLYRIIRSSAGYAVPEIKELQARLSGAVQNKAETRQIRLAWWQAVFTAALYDQERVADGFVERTAALFTKHREVAAAFSPAGEKAAEVSTHLHQLTKGIETIQTQLASLFSGTLLPAKDGQAFSAHVLVMQTLLQQISQVNTLPVAQRKQLLQELGRHARQAILCWVQTAGEKAGVQTAVLQDQLAAVLATVEKLFNELPAAEHQTIRKLSQGLVMIRRIIDQVRFAEEQVPESRQAQEETVNRSQKLKEAVNKIVGILVADLLPGHLPAAQSETANGADHAAAGTGIRIIDNCIEQLKILKSLYAGTVARQASHSPGGYPSINQLEEQLHEIRALLAEAMRTDDEHYQAALAKIGKMPDPVKALLAALSQYKEGLTRQAASIAEFKSRRRKQPGLPAGKSMDPFSETEKICIGNAGLVLTWPFLHRFFRNLGLADEKAFTDSSAAEKACVLLQHLTGTPAGSMFEAQLPLNKILCGIDWRQPVNTQQIIEPDEVAAAENFLLAVIQHGTLWKTLSIPGFRQAYLNREGLISTRDGNWLLQVKRETYDVVVDRLPWTTRIVKLPWMERLIFVEW